MKTELTHFEVCKALQMKRNQVHYGERLLAVYARWLMQGGTDKL